MSCFAYAFRPCLSGTVSQNFKSRRLTHPIHKLDLQQLPTNLPSRERLHTIISDLLEDDRDGPFLLSHEEERKDSIFLESKTDETKTSNMIGFDIGLLFDQEDQENQQEGGSVALCLICLEHLGEDTVVDLNVCQCKFHRVCLREYVGEEVKTRAFPIRCPGSECLKELMHQDLSSLLKENPEQFKNYKKFYTKFLAESYPDNFIICPDMECQYPLYIESQLLDNKLDCPECQQCYCLECELSWHEGISCKQAKKLEESDKKKQKKEREKQAKIQDKSFLKYAEGMKYRRCPKCGQVIEKVTGCNAMTCTRCQSMFCYRCGRKGDGHKCKHRLTCSMF